MRPFYLNRLVELVVSITVLIIFVPLIIPVLITVYFSTNQFPIIKQNRRIAFNKENIVVYKIRTIKETNQFKKIENSSNNIFNKHEYNKYVPLFCKWLRKSGIDELPQLINVIKGNLALVGPRPLLKKDLILLVRNELEYYKLRSTIASKPGLTGYWQVYGDRKKGAANLIEFDLKYEIKKSVSFNLKILFKTFIIMLKADHTDSIVNKI